MNGLFDNMAARFATDAPLEIRPRPQSRFEDRFASDSIMEQHGEHIARAPLEDQITPPAPRTAQGQAFPEKPTSPTQVTDEPLEDVRPAPTPLVDNARPAERAASTMDPPSHETPPSDLPHPEQISQEKEIVSKARNPHRPHDPRGANALEGPQATPQSAERISERIIETVVHAPELTQKPDPPRPAPSSQDNVTRRAPASASAPPTIKIGRIEVTRPAPPAPPPEPPPAAVRPSPPHRAPSMPRATHGSGLTEFLGWKKR